MKPLLNVGDILHNDRTVLLCIETIGDIPWDMEYKMQVVAPQESINKTTKIYDSQLMNYIRNNRLSIQRA